ncbi:unnamed protein product [Rotaria magnacalcarata]|uniref:DUF3533 domain-containing protein n=1 Tax=Rotaria magnacalcarata TaxID=392030 RepID=A0A8S2PKA3_9BILA|nr:unnamed protein product [Rotaria magnacalcarata]
MVSLIYSLVVLWLFHITSGRQFMRYWMFNWLCTTLLTVMVAFFVTNFGVISNLFLVATVIIMVSAATMQISLELSPRFFRYGYATPLYQAMNGGRHLLFNSHSRFGINVGVLVIYLDIKVMSFKYERFLIDAIEQFDLRKIIDYVKHGHNIHIKNDIGQNLLIHLLKQQKSQDPLYEAKRLKVFQYLILECKVDVNIVDYYNKNLFNWTTNLNCTREALYLLDTYPGELDILKIDNLGLCSLHYAIEHGNETILHVIVGYFVRYRIRFDVKDSFNNTPEELAAKLGYFTLAKYLSEANRSTMIHSRDSSFLQHRSSFDRLKTTGTFRTKTTLNTKTNMTSLSSYESSAVFVHDSLEIYNWIESKIERAKNLNDWKTVATLRTLTKGLTEKSFHLLPAPTLQIRKISTVPIRSQYLPNRLPSISESTHMLHLLEPQVSSSYRIPFVPICAKPVAPLVLHPGPSRSSMHKMSIASLRRMSSVMSLRKRDSTATQSSLGARRESTSRLSLSRTNKQTKQATVT